MAKSHIEKNMKMGIGRTEYLKYIKGERIGYKERCIARCYYCNNFYVDGRFDCGIKDCPIYPIMPYKNVAEGEDSD